MSPSRRRPAAQGLRRAARQRAARRDRRRLRHRRQAPVARRRPACSCWRTPRHRRRARRAHPRARTGLGGVQPGRHPRRARARRDQHAQAALFVAAQVVGCCLGVVLANLMFELPPSSSAAASARGAGVLARRGRRHLRPARRDLRRRPVGRAAHVAYAVGGYITAAYWFTSSTSFANPAITVGRTLSDTFAGIAPARRPLFVLMQLVGAALAVGAVLVLYPDARSVADRARPPRPRRGAPP